MTISTSTETVSGGDYRWLASGRGVGRAVSGTLDVSSFTISNGYIPSGTPVKWNSTSGLYEKAATTSTATTLGGFVAHNTVAESDDVTTAIMTDATIVADFVPGTHDLVDGRYILDAVVVAGIGS